MTAFDLETTFLALDGDGGVVQLPVGPEFWATIGSNPAAKGTLMGIYPMTTDWTHWEMHPRGDEVLMMMDGELELILDEAGNERHVRLGTGGAFVVPAGVWHRALVTRPGRLLGVTYGAGTEHRPV